jgi:DNA mismatch repair protein MutL
MSPFPRVDLRSALIRQLPEMLVNRIAAGEVIERPAAAVKELVENALDAGAGRIAVSLTGGGIERIEVSDDGCGMPPEGLALAVQRHCTSKLADGDLVRIATLGFRGEALPSIGAAGRLSIVSREAGAAHAHRIAVAGGVIEPVAPAPGAAGTRVTVEDLFFATPARRKFLKSPRTEADHAEAVVARLALARPDVAFRLHVEGRLAFDLPAQARRARMVALLGRESESALLEVNGEREEMVLSGFACAPMVSRPTASGQSLVVNGRPVTDPVLRTAIRVAYRDVIASGRHAVVALWLELPPEELDVNVHPAKTEVRFRQADLVRGLVIGTLQRTLSGGAGRASPRPSLRLVSYPPSVSPAVGGLSELSLGFGGAPPAARDFASQVPAALPDPATHPLGAAVAQVLDTYIIAATADQAVILVDQHAAHERLTQEALQAQLLAGGVRCQPLLLPAVVDLPAAQAQLLAQAAPELARLGLELEPFGAGAVLVRALPAALGAPDCQALIRDIADELTESGESVSLPRKLDAVMARMACHGSIRAGRRMNLAEMDALLRQMEATPRAATCSHGRPTFLRLTKAEIERLFGRR